MELLERLKLVRRRSCRLPTWRGWIAAGLVSGCAFFALIICLHPFLAITKPVATDVLLVEGWVPDFALRAAMEEFKAGKYRRLLVSGGPLEKGEPLSEFRTYAELGRATLVRFGFPTNDLVAIAGSRVRHDRTYASAHAVRIWLVNEGGSIPRLNVVTLDAHARRTRLLFQKAFEGQAEVGVIAVPDDRFEPSRWWRSSMGFRTVTGEAIGYAYARLLFSPPEEIVWR